MSGWLLIESIAFKLRTSAAIIRSHVQRLLDEGILQSRNRREGKEYCIVPRDTRPAA
jgi:predicted ArsR family transcriptional regulator